MLLIRQVTEFEFRFSGWLPTKVHNLFLVVDSIGFSIGPAANLPILASAGFQIEPEPNCYQKVNLSGVLNDIFAEDRNLTNACIINALGRKPATRIKFAVTYVRGYIRSRIRMVRDLRKTNLVEIDSD